MLDLSSSPLSFLSQHPYYASASVISLLCLGNCASNYLTQVSKLPLPPGPNRRPLIGNLLDMPDSHMWLKFAEWRKTFGDVIHLEVLGEHIIILNSAQATKDLLERRSAIYSDRPRMPMLNELMGWSWNFAFMAYSPWWRLHRKTFHQYFYQKAIIKHRPLQERESRRMLMRLLNTPNDFLHHARQHFAATILNVSYGLEVPDPADPYIAVAEEVVGAVGIAAVPGAFLVDTFPNLQYVPSWFPGADFKRRAIHWRSLLPSFTEKPFEGVRQSMIEGKGVPSIAASLIEKMKDKDNEIEGILAHNIPATSFAAGSDTTLSTVQSFFLTMAIYPEVQRKAQAQIDEVVGKNRLPTFDDRQNLPYVDAIVKESFRWQPVLPVAVAHKLMVDDEYRGYHIPKGSTVIGNTWAILHDEETYPNPDTFNPERWLNSDGSLNPHVQDPYVASFGFGRRICPGRYFAIEGAFILITSVLAGFNIEREGKEALSWPPQLEMTSAMISFPKPFDITITPRSDNAKRLIRESFEPYPPS